MTFAADTENWLSFVQAGGTVGVITVLMFFLRAFLSNQIVSGKSHEAEISRLLMDNTALRKELSDERKAKDDLANRAVPVLTEAAQALRDATGFGARTVESQSSPSRMDSAHRRAEMLADALSARLNEVEDLTRRLKGGE